MVTDNPEPDVPVEPPDMEAFEWALRIIAYRTIEEAGGSVVLSIADIAAFDPEVRIRMSMNDDEDIVLTHIIETAVHDDRAN